MQTRAVVEQSLATRIAVAAVLLAATLSACRSQPPAEKTPAAPPSAQTSAAAQPGISIEPNPIRVCDGSGLGVATIRWRVPAGVTMGEIHVHSPTGILFARGAQGTMATGKWVKDGMVFWFLDSSKAPTETDALGKVTARLTTDGC